MLFISFSDEAESTALLRGSRDPSCLVKVSGDTCEIQSKTSNAISLSLSSRGGVLICKGVYEWTFLKIGAVLLAQFIGRTWT
jgi:hypothetical protein